jgi:hypothetical protein
VNHPVRRSCYAACLLWSSIACLTVAQAQTQDQNQPPKDFEKDEGAFQKERDNWFYGQRAYPHAKIPAGARLRAFQQLTDRLAAEQAARGRANTAGDVGSWQLIGPATMNLNSEVKGPFASA